jgi:hypothetical protein
VTAFACLSIAAVVSATVFAQMRQGPSPKNTLNRPAGYRSWISIGSTANADVFLGPHHPGNASSHASHKVYIDDSAFRQYSQTGKFAEGTILVMEVLGNSGEQPIALTATVKDSRLEGGWGYFNFTNVDGTIADKAESIVDKSTCRSCHSERARFDHVFTQFHPGLKTAT